MKILKAFLLLYVSQSKLHSSVGASDERRLRAKQSVKHSKSSNKSSNKSSKPMYEVWGSDQSNSVPNATGPGTKGGLLWIWDSDSIQGQLDKSGGDAKPLSCTPNDEYGPCDLLQIFPEALVEYKDNKPTTNTLSDLSAFGRLHGFIADPTNRYVTANIFAPGGGYVGVIDTETKEAISLFRVTKVNTSNERSVHMSFWSHDGSAIIVANLHGKMVERINVIRDDDGIITDLQFDRSASVFLGKNFELKAEASYFMGMNAFEKPLLGSITGSYEQADTGDLTPTGACKESSCDDSTAPMEGGGRLNNVPVCPITSANNNAYVTLGGGGLIVLKTSTTPMQIVGEYGDAVVNGAGCAGAQVGDTVFINAGVSAGNDGFEQSTFTLYALDDTLYNIPNPNSNAKQNFPMPEQVFKDPTNTNTLGNIDGIRINDSTGGQLPNLSTRRDAHGAIATIDGKYVHVADRIQNVVEVFKSDTFERVNTYDLVSKDGASGRSGPSGPCLARSVTDDAGLMLNDPAPDLSFATPDGKYLMIAFRGPKPVTVSHSAQGSCPGVGIVEITDGGKSGRLVDVLRATNTVDNVAMGAINGGHEYKGAERSDIHGAIVVSR